MLVFYEAIRSASPEMTYDQFMAALCIWREARGATMPAMAAIFAVLQNRTNDPKKRWARTLAQVVRQPHQFSSFSEGDPNSLLFPDQADEADWGAWQRAMITVRAPLGADPTNGATNYESCSGTRPVWADPAKLTCTIGPFRFYAL